MFCTYNTFSKEKNRSYLQFSKIGKTRIVNIYEKSKIKIFYKNSSIIKGKFYITNDSIITINSSIIHLDSVNKIITKNPKAKRVGTYILSFMGGALLAGGIHDIIKRDEQGGGDVGFQKARGTAYAGILMLYPSIIGASLFGVHHRFNIGTKWNVKIVHNENTTLFP